MRKKITAMALVVLMLLTTMPLVAAADDDIQVVLDEEDLVFDVPPQIINGSTMVPLRAIFEAMGASVSYDSATQTVTATKGMMMVEMTVGNTTPKIITAAGSTEVPINQAAVIIDGRTLAPLRFVAEAFGGSVSWDGSTQTATIMSNGVSTPTPPVQEQPPAQEEVQQVATSGYSYTGQTKEVGGWTLPVEKRIVTVDANWNITNDPRRTGNNNRYGCRTPEQLQAVLQFAVGWFNDDTGTRFDTQRGTPVLAPGFEDAYNVIGRWNGYIDSRAHNVESYLKNGIGWKADGTKGLFPYELKYLVLEGALGVEPVGGYTAGTSTGNAYKMIETGTPRISCADWSQMIRVNLDILGLPNAMMTGYNSRGYHAWVRFELDGQTLYYDYNHGGLMADYTTRNLSLTPR